MADDVGADISIEKQKTVWLTVSRYLTIREWTRVAGTCRALWALQMPRMVLDTQWQVCLGSCCQTWDVDEYSHMLRPMLWEILLVYIHL